MARSSHKPITFIVPDGRQADATGRIVTRAGAAGLGRGRLEASIQLAATRGGGETAVVAARPGRDVVVLHIDRGPALVLHPESARDLLLAQRRDASDRSTGTDGDGVLVPARLQWHDPAIGEIDRGAPRGVGDVVLTGLDVIADLVGDKAADFAASAVVRRVDAQVNPGLYELQPDALPQLKGRMRPVTRLPSVPNNGPLLVLVHGTFTETSESFSRLWVEHPQRVRSLFDHYNGRVYGLDHPTLGASPIANAMTLAKACPQGARLHLLTHSRGGLVAEVLARVCSEQTDRFEPFAGHEYQADRAELKALTSLVRQRGIRVDRIVRVACPARGTFLASKRLDAYVSVFKWTLELAGVPVAPVLIDFLAEVAKRRADPAVLPGLAAMLPESPLVKWLHQTTAPIDGSLRVVAGDLEADSVTSWIKTLLADGFFWTDNDLIVQTRSMYGGPPRRQGAVFALDQGSGVSHFRYFSNERTAGAIVNALAQDEPDRFLKIGPLSWAGESATGTRAPKAGPGNAERPAAVLVGLPRASYTELVEFLSRTHEVSEVAFEWKRPVEDQARRLATHVARLLTARNGIDSPVRILTHSAGALVARTIQIVRPDVWTRLMAKNGARLLMLGPPNGGFWTPMQVLSGDDTSASPETAIGPVTDDAASRRAMASGYGFVQLQAELGGKTTGLSRRSTWTRLADADSRRAAALSSWHNLDSQREAYRWGVPTQRILDRAAALWRRLERQRAKGVLAESRQVAVVVGEAPFTPYGYEEGPGGLAFLEYEAGDGRVTHESAMLPGVPAWRVNAEHLALGSTREAFPAYLELLQTGNTELLVSVTVPGSTRGAVAAKPPAERRRLFRMPAASRSRAQQGCEVPLRVTVINGDLSFVRHPLLLGHYRALRLTGTERVMDRLVGGAMDRSLRANLYPDVPGTHQIFINTHIDPNNPWRLPRPEAVIVLGLGAEGKLAAAELATTVSQGVIAWAQRATEKPLDRHTTPPRLEIAATLIGSGGTGISAGQSAQLIAQGVRAANERLASNGWPTVSALHLIELYLDRAGDAWRALHVQVAASPEQYVLTETVQKGPGALMRPLDSGYRGVDYDFISATMSKSSDGAGVIEYTLDTKRARTEVRALATQAPLVRELVASASNDRSQDTRIGRTLFQLLVPAEMEPFFGGSSEMLIELDGGTAGIPWELLDASTDTRHDPRPWAIRVKLLRKLRTSEFRTQVIDARAEAAILVIGEPKVDPERYRRLPGARAEARAVADLLSKALPPAGGLVTPLISPDDPSQSGPEARTVVTTLLERDWRIVHIAGHGEPPASVDDPRGVVLSKGTFLGPREIGSMRVVPELVFVNCCHLAARDPGELLVSAPDRPAFAASMAEKLIAIGVRAVIAAGWAVDDIAARAFATSFYERLLRGDRFIDAVAAARDVAHTLGGNTWAAYQCYGDPDWKFRPEAPDAQSPSISLEDEFSGVASSFALRVALETLAVRTRVQGVPDEQIPRLRYLEQRFSGVWGRQGEVAEAFGHAWAETGDWSNAIGWYRKALSVEDGMASFRTAEQLSNLLGRTAEKSVAALHASGPRKIGERLSPKAVAEARGLIAEAMSLLDRLLAIQPTMERESLYGSAFKRLALIESAAGRREATLTAISGMIRHYGAAEAIARRGGDPNFYYPAINRIAAELALNAGRAGWQGLDQTVQLEIRQNLTTKVRSDPDFWSVTAQTELTMFEAVGRGTLADALDSIEKEFDDLHARVGAPRYWASVHDTARFVLGLYSARVSDNERKASHALLKRLETYAHASN
ncbi:MAG TPA: CHAT domain-containing protein [Vicinamibacterales bacterium]|nr:CHAT domain-containing protein [Vicinamibacterales bacterium]